MAKVVRSYKTGKATVDVLSDGTKLYKGYSKKNSAGKPTDRKITIKKKAGEPDSSEHTARTEENNKRRSSGKKTLPKGKPGKGVQVAHKPGSSRSSTGGTRVESASKNIGDGNRARKGR